MAVEVAVGREDGLAEVVGTTSYTDVSGLVVDGAASGGGRMLDTTGACKQW